MIVSLVPREAVPDIVDLVREYLDVPIKMSGGRISWFKVLAEIGVGDLTLWVVLKEGEGSIEERVRGFATARIIRYPEKMVLSIELLSGAGFTEEYGEEMDRVLSNFGRDSGCSHMEAHGRKGWRRVLDKLSFEEKFVTYEKAL